MLKGTQNQIKIVRVTSKLSHWDLRLKCIKQDNNLQEYPELDSDLRLQYNEQDNYLLEYPDLEAVLRLKSNEQNNHLQEDPDLKADMQEYTDLEVGLRLKSNEQDNHLQEYLDVGADMQEYTEEGNDFEGYSEEYNETNVEESILPELYTVQQHSKVKIEINEELHLSDNLIQVKEEVLSDIDIDESETDTTDCSDINIRVKEEFNESQQHESTYSIFDEINKHSKEADAIAKYFEKVKNSLKTEKVDEVPKSSKLDAIAGTEFSTVKCNVCLKGFLGDEAYNEHMKNHTTKDTSPSEVIPSKTVVKVGNPLADNRVMVEVKKIRVKRLAKAKSNENKTTKKYFTRSSVKNIVENVDKPFSGINPKKNGSRKSEKNIVDSTSTQNNNYNSIRNYNYVEVNNDSSTVKVESNKSVKINGDSGVAIDYDNDLVKVDNDSKVKVDEDNDNSTVKENEDLLIEIPGKTKVEKLPKGKRKQSKEKTNNNVKYKVCDESCTDKKLCTQSKECRMKQRTKQYINTCFACTQCDYKGSQKYHLDRHMLIHNGVKNFHCNLCDYKCFRQCYLVRHMRAHSKNIIYSCNFCGYECVQMSQLNQHAMRRHAGVKPFSCTKSKKYASRNSAKNIVDRNTIQNNNYSSVRNDNNVEVGSDNKFKVCLPPNKVGTCQLVDNNFEVGSDNKFKVDDKNDSSTAKENKDLLIEIPGKTKVLKLPKEKRKQSKEKTKRLYNHHNLTYKVCDESCTDKKLCTQSKECRMKQRTKQYINTCFACTQCDYKGSQKYHLDRHMLIHNGVKNFHCNLCDYKCFRQCYLVRHMRAHSKNIIYSCNFCGYECVQMSQLNQHAMRRHAGVKPFSCTKSKKYASRNSAKNIVDSNTIQNNNYSSVRNDNNIEVGSDNKFKVCLPPNEVGTCQLVDNNFEVGSDNKFKVDDENDSSTVKENKHLLIEMPGKTKVVKLPKGKRKQSKERTMRWYNRHNNVTYKVCDDSCTDKKLCTQSKECRMKQRTKQYINTRFACTQCDYKGSQKYHLDRHMLIHNEVKNFHCNLCDYKCVQQCNLNQHMRTHSKTKPYSCNFCDYICVQRSQLDQHMRRHTGVKPFSCNICEYTCTQRCHLDQHMRRHTGIRPFLCIHCDYKFVQRSHLNQHIMKIHRNVQVYDCSHCGYRCLQLDLLARHMKIHECEYSLTVHAIDV